MTIVWFHLQEAGLDQAADCTVRRSDLILGENPRTSRRPVAPDEFKATGFKLSTALLQGFQWKFWSSGFEIIRVPQ